MNTSHTSSLPKTVAIVGCPNVGKSLLFGQLTHRYSFVGNYPKSTLKIERGECVIDCTRWEIADCPGFNSFLIASEEEIITRDFLFDLPPDALIQCVDIKNVERGLFLFFQLRELHRPIVWYLTMSEEGEKAGVAVNVPLLQEMLGITVVEKNDVSALKAAINKATPPKHPFAYPERIEKLLGELRECFPSSEPPLALAQLLLATMGEPSAEETIEKRYGTETAAACLSAIEAFKAKSNINPEKLIENQRQRWVDMVAKRVIEHPAKAEPSRMLEKIGWLSRHSVWGWPMLAFNLWIMYLFVGRGSGVLSGLLDYYVFLPMMNGIRNLLDTSPLLLDLAIGDYGVVSMGVFNALGTVVPVLICFFLLLSVYEDVGYLSNLSVLLTRLFQLVGLNGKAAFSMILALGCNTMATLTTRMLETKKERFIAIFIIALGIPCSVQFGVMLAILSTIHFSAIFIVFGTVILLQIVSAVLLNRLMKEKEDSFFLIELPPIRVPDFRNVVVKTALRCKWFLIEALPLFVYASFFLLFLKYTHLLVAIREIMRPIVVTFLNLPSDIAEVFIMVLARREVGVVLFKNHVDTGELDFVQIVVGLTAITLFVPCMSNTMVMVRELGVTKAVGMVGMILFLAIAVAGLLNIGLRLIL